MPAALRVPLVGPAVVLCEGAADAAFLRELRDRRGIGPFDLPFPPRTPQPKGEPPLHGIDGFGNMLQRIADEARLDLTLPSRLLGIVMVADAGDSASDTLIRIAGQYSRAGFGVPSLVKEWTLSPAPHPSVAALLVPSCGAAGLETLCLDYLRPVHPDVSACLDAYLACIPPLSRSREKQDKAALACLVAAIGRTDPTMTIARAFSGSSPLVDVLDPIFTPFADALAALLADLPQNGETP